MKIYRKKVFIFACMVVAFVCLSCENHVEIEETYTGDSVLTLYADTATGDVATQQFNANTLFKVKQNPFSRDGYRFLGWSDTPRSQFVMYNNRSEMAFRGDKTLYAVWELKNYTVTYKLNGGRKTMVYPEFFTVLNGTTLNPARNGKYIFAGWYDNAQFAGQPLTEIKAGTIGDKTVYARWCGTLSYHLGGGSFVDFTPDADSPEVVIPLSESDEPEELAATVAGSELSAVDDPSLALETLPADDDVDFGADDALFDDADGADLSLAASVDPVEAESDEPFDLDAPAGFAESVASAELSELDERAESDDSVVPDELANEADELVAVTDSDSEADTVDDTEQTVAAADETHLPVVCYYTVETDIALPIPQKDGFVFGGWYYDADFTQSAELTIHAPTAATIDVYAKWNEIKNYAITYELSGGSNAEENLPTYTNSAQAVPLFAPTRYGFVFDGWYADAQYAGTAVTEIPAFAIGDQVLYAKWARDTFTVTYCAGNAEEGKVPPSVAVLYEDALVASENVGELTRDGAVFMGWYVRPTVVEAAVEAATQTEPADEDATESELTETVAETESETEATDSAAEENASTDLADTGDSEPLAFVAPGEKYTVTEPVSLYPVWKLVKYRIVAKTKDAVVPKNNQVTAVVLPDAVRALGNAVFADFSSLKTIQLASITAVGKSAFAGCTALTSVDLTTVKVLGNLAFDACQNLRTVVLPAAPVTTIGMAVFKHCPDGIQFITTKEQYEYYSGLLTPAVVGKPAESYTIVVPEQGE